MVRQHSIVAIGTVLTVYTAVMNLTEMESMVREATNADPWGAPSTTGITKEEECRY